MRIRKNLCGAYTKREVFKKKDTTSRRRNKQTD